MSSSALEIRLVSEVVEQPLLEFFRILKREGDDKYFHPHPLCDEEAKRLAHYSGKDLYYVLLEGNRVLGYGMLRGWDAGYEVPSLGIAIHPSVRGMGLSKLFMHFLHAAAKRKGATKIRLKVHSNNATAVTLYKELGYSFESESRGQLVGFIDLNGECKENGKGK